MAVTQRGEAVYEYEPFLMGEDGSTSFQWSLRLTTIVEEDHTGKKAIFEVLNRTPQRVGPTFTSRDKGSRYLGFEGKSDSSGNWNRLIEEYDNLFTETIITRRRFSKEEKRFGRPSQGRSERLQFSTTRDVAEWISSQSQDNESVSETIHRMLESLRNS